MLDIGDQIIINESAIGKYSKSSPGSIGTIVLLSTNYFYVYFPPPFQCDPQGWYIRKEHCSYYPGFCGPSETPINLKIKVMDKRYKARLQNKGVPNV